MRATRESGAEPGGLGDAQLVVAVARYGEDALAELYRRHAPAVLSLARRVTGDAGTAEDVVQEVFLRLWNQPDRFDPGRGSLRSYLLAQAHSRAVDIVRSRAARARREERQARAAANAGYDLEREVWDLAVADQVAQALASLPTEERAAIELAYYDGHTYREVATILSQPEGTVKSRIRNGMRRMRKLAGRERREGTMTADSDHHQIEELLGAYVLDAVEPDEAARVERHLEGCPRCRAEVDAGREVAGRLGTSARAGGAEPLPPGLWDRIAGGIATSARRPPGPMPGLGAAPPPAAEVAAITDATTARRRRWRGAGWAAAAVAVAAVIAVAVLGVDLAHTNNQLNHPDQSAAVRAALATPTHRLVRLDSLRGCPAGRVRGAGGRAGLHGVVGHADPALRRDLPAVGGHRRPAHLGGALGPPTPTRASFTLASTATPERAGRHRRAGRRCRRPRPRPGGLGPRDVTAPARAGRPLWPGVTVTA